MNVLVVSLNFNPGHFSHLIANYKLFEDCGFSPWLFVNKSFNAMDEDRKFKKINDPRELKKLPRVDIAVFWFPSLKNVFEIFRLRVLYKSRIVYIYHEPFDTIANYYKSGFRVKKILKICLVNLVNIPVILLSHRIVLPSESSFSLYKKKYAGLNAEYRKIPLLFDDEADAFPATGSKGFISYIGTVAADHAFDKFVDFIDRAISNDWFPDHRYLVATGSVIPAREKAVLERHAESGKIVISEGHPMTNTEINGHFASSMLVWNAYNRSMQSGVLPKAYMFGAAVIVLSRNANEFIDNHKTGVLIKDNGDAGEIRKAVEDIIALKDDYSANCRNKFLECFYYKNKIADYLSILDVDSRPKSK